jgi:uncharacterized protein with PQ loop repeat
MNEENPYLRSLVIIANIIGFVYNVPQVILTIRTKSAKDLSSLFLIMRIVSALLWIIYTSVLWSPDVLISWIITGCSSGILFYYKIMYSDHNVCGELFFWKKNKAIELKEDMTPTEQNTNV